MTLNQTLCAEVIGGPDGFWGKAATTWAACQTYAPLVQTVTALHAALICRHDNAAGQEALKRGTDWLLQNAPELAPMFPACALGALLPEAMRHYRLLGTPEDILFATFADMRRWIVNYAAAHDGAFGLDEISWVTNPYAGNIFEIGCLQFQMFNNPFSYACYEVNGVVTVVPMSGLAVNDTGHVCGTNGNQNEAAFTTSLTVENGCLTCNAVDSTRACILPHHISFSLADSHLLTAPGLPTLNVHIPGKTDLSPEIITQSARHAQGFFRTLGFPCTAALCESWLLDPLIHSFLPSQSKITQFANRFTCFPVFSEMSWAGRFIFSTDFYPAKLAQVVPVTSLQKKVHAHLTAGGELFDTCGLWML